MARQPSSATASRRRLNRIEPARGEPESLDEDIRRVSCSAPPANHSANRIEQVAAGQGFGNDLLNAERLRGRASGRETGAELSRQRDQGSAWVRNLDPTDQRARMLGHVN